MNKSFSLTCKQDVIDLIRNQEYQDSLWDTYDFTTYGSGHPQMPILSHDGYNIRDDDVEFKLYRRCSLKESMLQTDTSSYANYSVKSLENAIGSVRASLERHYDALLDKADELQMELLYLMMLMRLRKRFDIKPVQHTSNQWERRDIAQDREYTCERSNMVFKMQYHVYRGYRWDQTQQKEIPTDSWRLSWDVWTQSLVGKPLKIGAQDKKFRSESEMKSYLAGRIKAYDKYFKEISPPIPEEYLSGFVYAGQLLLGYRQEEKDDGEALACEGTSIEQAK